MSRPATLKDHLAALRAKAQRASRAERAWGYYRDGWSPDIAVKFADGSSKAEAIIDAYLEALDPYEHGLEPPFSTPTSGRTRKAQAPFIPWYQRGGLDLPDFSDGVGSSTEGFVEPVGPACQDGGHGPVGDTESYTEPVDRQARPDDNGVGSVRGGT